MKEENDWNRNTVKTVRKEEEEKMLESWKSSLRDKKLPGVLLRGSIHQVFSDWITRRHGGMNYSLTQILTGHGCFNAYLERIKKLESALCTYCEGFIDDAEHTLCQCEEWNTEREEMKIIINCSVNLGNIVKAICNSKEIYLAVSTSAQKVMSRKEEDERREKQETGGNGE